MPHIEQLSSHVADLIAAGEVVERPASVVKELLENAIDAGAAAVTVEIRSGGMTYLRVTDDGCGIAENELPTAFLRHATSKLRTASDLAAIGTLGFRGEALAAISSVSRLDIFSRERGSDSGAALHLEGGVPETVMPAGCPEGTSVIVRDLFYNTPARLKFMKRDSAEATAISGLVAHLALSHPNISFRLLKDGEETLHTPGDSRLKSAIYASLGREFTHSLVEMNAKDGSLAASGFITLPLMGRGSRAMQTFFVNGRLVKSQLLTAALEEAYTNRSMKGKFPGCVLLLTVPHDMVDVNVHPAKTIVKFVNEKAVFDLVYHGAMDTLDGKKEEIPTPASTATNPRGDFFTTMTAAQYREKQVPAPKSAAPRPQPFKTSVPAFDSELSGRMKASDFIRIPAAPKEPPKTAPRPTAPAAHKSPEISAPREAESADVPQIPVPESVPEAGQTTIVPKAVTPWRIAGEVLNTYIVCEDEDKTVWLIDKHAAHERINFDRFQAQREPIMPQTLLSPIAADFSADAYSALMEQSGLLREFGFCVEEFGERTLLIREIPSDIDSGDAIPALEELAEKLASAHTPNPASARDALLHTMACKAAIKGGWKTSEKELRALVDKVQSGEVQFCPHGRPVKVKLTRYELEKMFKRA